MVSKRFAQTHSEKILIWRQIKFVELLSMNLALTKNSIVFMHEKQESQ